MCEILPSEACFLCSNLMPEWQEVVSLKRKIFSFQKGETIFREGEKVEGVYFILSGKVKVDMSWGDKSYIVRLASQGEILGHRGFGSNEHYPVNAKALEATTVSFIPSDLFITLIKTNPELHFKLTFFYAEQLQQSEQRMKNLAHMPVKGRVAETLIQVRDAFGLQESDLLAYRMSRKDMAAMAGTTYETVIRMLNELVEDGLIKLLDRDIQLLDAKALEDCCRTELMEQVVE